MFKDRDVLSFTRNLDPGEYLIIIAGGFVLKMSDYHISNCWLGWVHWEDSVLYVVG
jgi:hypothetical protein